LRKIKAIWKIIFSDRFFVYTSNCYGTGEFKIKCDEVDLRLIQGITEDYLEVEESVNYVKSLLTEI